MGESSGQPSKTPLSCGAQDMLETAIVQKRRINLTVTTEDGCLSDFSKVLPVDIGSHQGQEVMEFMAVDNKGGIIKLSVNTADIVSFEADDLMSPRIQFNNKSLQSS